VAAIAAIAVCGYVVALPLWAAHTPMMTVDTKQGLSRLRRSFVRWRPPVAGDETATMMPASS